MLTLRDCFVIATLFAIPLGLLRYVPHGGFFLFMPASMGVWFWVARRNAIASPAWRIIVSAAAGVVVQACGLLLLGLLNRTGSHQFQTHLNPFGTPEALPCFLVCAAIGGACIANFGEAWLRYRSRR